MNRKILLTIVALPALQQLPQSLLCSTYRHPYVADDCR